MKGMVVMKRTAIVTRIVEVIQTRIARIKEVIATRITRIKEAIATRIMEVIVAQID